MSATTNMWRGLEFREDNSLGATPREEVARNNRDYTKQLIRERLRELPSEIEPARAKLEELEAEEIRLQQQLEGILDQEVRELNERLTRRRL